MTEEKKWKNCLSRKRRKRSVSKTSSRLPGGDIFGGGSFNIINFLFVPFLTLTVGIPMYWVSVIMLISKVWDGIIDPFIGKISDGKQPGRFGKRRFFMLVCAPILIVATILCFPLESCYDKRSA